MRIFRRRSNGDGGVALADRPGIDQFEDADEATLVAEIEARRQENRGRRHAQLERELMDLRHLLGVRRVQNADAGAQFAAPDATGLAEFDGALPEVTPAQLTPAILRAAILRDGCLLVRGLLDRDRALAFADGIERAYGERERHEQTGADTDGDYQVFRPRPEAGEPIEREWIKMGGGLLAVDSPRLAAQLLDLLGQSGFPALVAGYLGEPALWSAQKTTLRKAAPSVAGAWHQDGKFMGAVRALNLWLSLSRCGDVAPGLDVVPRRLDFVRTQTEEAMLDYQVSQLAAEQAAGDRPILRPIFEPGDALLFDEMFLHKTGSDPSMPHPRFAVESWFFGASGFPDVYAPVAT